MTAIILTRYLHFIAVFAIVGALVSEQFLVSKTMSRKEIKLISKVDIINIAGIILALVGGLILWFWVGKPAEYYTKNWIFHTKLTLFIGLIVLSVYPTIFFWKNKNGEDLNASIHVPKVVMICMRLEIILLIVLPILATLMSVGVGSF